MGGLGKSRFIVAHLTILLFVIGSDAVAGACNGQIPLVIDTLSDGLRWSCRDEYSDEFNDTKLDTTKWNPHVKSWGQWSWDASNVEVNNGLLRLRMSHLPHVRDGTLLHYKSGVVKSRATPIKYGYIEARIKAAPRFPGACSAFWMYRVEKNQWTEIDIAELLQRPDSPNVVDQTLHVFRGSNSIGGRQEDIGSLKTAWNPSDDFHTYGLWWDESTIRWYVDGKLTKARRNSSWHQALNITFSLGLRRPLTEVPSGAGFPTEMEVDYIRVWAH